MMKNNVSEGGHRQQRGVPSVIAHNKEKRRQGER